VTGAARGGGATANAKRGSTRRRAALYFPSKWGNAGRLARVTHAGAVLRSRATLLAFLAAVAFALGHQVTYLVEYGANASQALARSGHELQWTLAVVSIACLSLLLAALAARELLRLSRQARGLKSSDDPRFTLSALAREVVLLALGVFVAALVTFVIVENVEYAAAGLPPPGLTLLMSPEHQQTLLVFELVSLAVAFVAALYRWRRDFLVELIELALRLCLHRRASLGPRPTAQTMPAHWIIRRRPPGRAPPLLA